jgi:hypothetical protein
MPIFRKGLKVSLPSSAALGEPLVVTDTNELWIGKGDGLSPVPLNVKAALPTTYGAIATLTSSQSIATSTTETVNFNSIESDPYSSISTGSAWKYTAQLDGFYDISAMISYVSSTWAANTEADLSLYKNGVLARWLNQTYISANLTLVLSVIGKAKIFLAKNDYIDIRTIHNKGAAISLQASSQMSWVAIARKA